jgi:hypothetical protein
MLELDGRLNYNRVVREFKDPRFHRGAARVHRHLWNPSEVHMGRTFLYVIYPTIRSAPSTMRPFNSDQINIHGLRVTSEASYLSSHLSSKRRMDYFTHDDIDKVLVMLGKKRFKSKRKAAKVKMVLDHV